MREPPPVLVADLFPALLEELLDLLTGLTTEEWDKATVCAPWTVKDLTLHLLGDEIGILSRRDRDEENRRRSSDAALDWPALVALINNQNDLWVRASRRLSNRLACDLMRFLGEQTCQYFASLDPFAMGVPVDWVRAEPAPVWLDTAREFTERWHHQQQIRDAVNRPPLTQARFLGPVLAAFVLALPRTYQTLAAEEGTTVALTITGEAGGKWFLLRENNRWQLSLEAEDMPNTEVLIPQELAWRLFTKGLDNPSSNPAITVSGDRTLGLKLLETVSIIA